MKILTKQEALNRLDLIRTEKELRDLIKSLDTRGSGKTTLLWSGPPGEGIKQELFARSLASGNNDFRAIQSTEAAKFLQIENPRAPDYNEKLLRKLQEIFKNNEAAYYDFLYGPSTGNPPKRIGKGVWDDVSENFVKQARGDVRLVVGGAGLDRVFAQTEIHALLANPAVKTIEGVPIEGLKELARTSGVTKVVQLLMGLSEANTGMIKLQVDTNGRPIQAPDGTYRVDATDYMKMNTLNTVVPAGMRSVIEFIPEERRLRHIQAVEEILKINPILQGKGYKLPLDSDPFRHQTAIARISTYTGRIADVYSLTTMLAEAGDQLRQGDHRRAHNTVTSWVTETAGGIAAGRLATLLVAPLMATGPLGMLIGAGIIIGASIGGADLAKKLQRRLHKRFKDIDELATPLILDLDGNGVQTLPLRSTAIHFDHDSNGFAEQTGWVGTKDGLLVLDLNNNGKVDNGGELFGNYTRLANQQLAKNGFEALARYDSNRDGRIDNRDTIWQRLRVWRDHNSNAVSETGELFKLEAVKVRALLLNYKSSKEVDANGNAHKEKGSFQQANGSLAALTDVWFVKDTLNSRQLNLRKVDAATAALPNLPGMGIVPSLHQALMAPGSLPLRKTLTAWLGATRLQRMALRQDLVFLWCDAANNPFSNKKRMVDGDDPLLKEKVAVLEKLMGQVIPNGETFIGPNKATAIPEATAEIQQWIELMLSAQVDLQPLLDLAIPIETDSHGPLQLDLTAAADRLRSQFKRDPDPGVIPMIHWQLAQRGPGGLAFFESLRRFASTTSDAFALAMRQQRPATEPWEWISGTPDSDGLGGTETDDFLEGGASYDALDGYAGNDTLHGGPGSDSFYGGAGGDTYYISQNQGSDFDTVFDESSHGNVKDRVIFWELASSQVRLERFEQTISFYSGQQLVTSVMKQLHPEHCIEEFHFADGVILDHNSLLLQVPVQGTPGNDRLVGVADTSNRFQGLTGHDTLIGGALSDRLEGQQGNDVLTGLAGQDSLDGGEGNDTLEGGEGADHYFVAANGGHDRVLDVDQLTSENDRVMFRDLKATDLTRVQRFGSDLQLQFGDTTSLTLVNQLHPFSRIEQVQFADGTTWDQATLLQRAT